MTKGVDVYQPCPCGSGKKIKFCCQSVIEEMDYAFELIDERKYGAARTVLDGARKKAGATGRSLAWVLSALGAVDFIEQKVEDAGGVAEAAIAADANFPDAHFLQALVLDAKGDFDNARKSMDRGFRHVGATAPQLASELLVRFAGEFAERRSFLAARACLFGIALCLGGDERSREPLRRFESDPNIPYPFRGPWPLRPAPEGVAWGTTATEAAELFSRLAFYAAAEKYREIVEKNADSAMFFNLGLALGSIGNDKQAALAFRRAAHLDNDFERSVETEALAQLIEVQSVLTPSETANHEYLVSSFEDLDAKLDSLPRCASVTVDPDPRTGALPPLVRYVVLDRPWDEADHTRPVAERPRVVGMVALFKSDAAGQNRPLAYFSESSELGDSSAKAWLDSEVGSLWSSTGNVMRDRGIAAEWTRLFEGRYAPEDESYADERRRMRGELERMRDVVFPAMKLTALAGRSPLEAKDTPEFKVPLAAALLVFESMCDSMGHSLDEGELRAKFGLPEVSSSVPGIDEERRVATSFEARRVELAPLPERAFVRLYFTGVTSGRAATVERLLREAIRRSREAGKPVGTELWVMLARVTAKQGHKDAALATVEEGRATAKGLREQLEVDCLEIMIRADDPSDPQLELVAYRVWHQYVPKLPELRANLTLLLSRWMPKGPWAGGLDLSGSMAVPESGSVTSGGIWTPESAGTPAGGGGGKLWVPGS